MFIRNVFYSSLIYDQSDNTVIHIAAQIWWYIHPHWIDFQTWMTRWKCKCNENMLLNIYFLIIFPLPSIMYERTLVSASLPALLNFSQSDGKGYIFALLAPWTLMEAKFSLLLTCSSVLKFFYTFVIYFIILVVWFFQARHILVINISCIMCFEFLLFIK